MTQYNVSQDIVGGPNRHLPVMLNEVLCVVEPCPGQVIIDGTFGAGGYTSAFLDKGAGVLAIDRDPDAVKDGVALVEKFPSYLKLVHGEFSEMSAIADEQDFESVDGVVLDIGVSSMQIDQADRGFSFQKDGPLDMRMARSGVSAADVVNHARQADLTRIIGILGEERKASRVSGAIARSREKAPFTSTLQLAGVVEQAVGRKQSDRIHPATRTFQALRIYVNRELEQLAQGLLAAEKLLKNGGRLVVVTFHSLEDRMVKLFFRDRSSQPATSRHMPQPEMKKNTFSISGKGVLKPSKAEMMQNPRSRSAKLRWAMRTETANRPSDLSFFGLPDLASIGSFSPGDEAA